MANITDVEPASKKAKSDNSQKVTLNSEIAKADHPSPKEVHRKDYAPLAYTVTKVSLDFKLFDRRTVVESVLTVEKNSITDTTEKTNDNVVDGLDLDGDETVVSLLKLSVDGCNELVPDVDYILQPGKLCIKADALHRGASANNGVIVVRSTVEIIPEDNTQLSGLYKDDSGMYCSQCEAQGFRRITYYPDRPDNMATFERVRIEADSKEFPVLLSNGNLVEEGESEGRKFAIWSDPFPKPSYLFAIVAGDLRSIEDSFTTMSGRKVLLRFFSEHKNAGKLEYAMGALKRAMKWDEETFGLEYDLDLFNVVAVESFNMGAMENKSLNVFNTSCVLADPITTSDANYLRIEGIIGHEYFHNWTGNRVTCRDWFQLTLKEGLTVFRDQQFSGMINNCASVQRIQNVLYVRGAQFKEDSGPMAHPIRPDSYIAMDNFYTGTVYRKGAEVIRMYNTLLGTDGFRKGMDLYFKRHDGQAVTCDDFLAAMADANDVDLSQFALWYSTSGTPSITYSSTYDKEKSLYQLTLTQSSRSDDPMLIPVAVGLLDKESGAEVVPTTVLQLKEVTQTFDFPNIKGDVVPSILRNFSAPVKLKPVTGVVDETELAFLASKDTDEFNRWDSAQKLYEAAITKVMNKEAHDYTLNLVLTTFGDTLKDESISDDSIRAFALTLPSESALSSSAAVIDPPAIRIARKQIKQAIARTYSSDLLSSYNKLTAAIKSDGETFKVDGVSVGRRRLRNVYLGYLCSIASTGDEQRNAASIATKHFESATGMTDKLAAFNILASMSGEGAEARDLAIKNFYEDAKGDSLVLNKWFAVQGDAHLDDVLERVIKLTSHPDFTLKNPNRARALILSFTANAAAFHDELGNGYKWLGDILEKMDKINSKVAARTTASSLLGWKSYNEKRALLMKAQLERLRNMPDISNDLLEIVTKGLK